MTSDDHPQTSEYDIGAVGDFEDFPEPVTIEGKRFFLVDCDGQFELFSSACPHRGGPVYFDGDRFECPVHDWTFDAEAGERLDGDLGCLTRLQVERRGDRLLAHVSPSDLASAHPDHSSSPESERGELAYGLDAPAPDDLGITADTNVGAALEALGGPARKILADYGMRCLGCALATHESLAEAAEVHQLDDEEFRELLERLRNLEGD